jgi:hypothetical protein
VLTRLVPIDANVPKDTVFVMAHNAKVQYIELQLRFTFLILLHEGRVSLALGPSLLFSFPLGHHRPIMLDAENPGFKFYLLLTDINECFYSKDNDCSRYCINTPGAYKCGCPTGYKLVEATKCIGTYVSLF